MSPARLGRGFLIVFLLVGALAGAQPSVAPGADADVPTPPPPKTGSVGLSGGVRWVPQDDFIRRLDERVGRVLQRSLVSPAAHVQFAYRIDRDWVALVDVGWSPDTLRFARGESVTLSTVSLAISGQRLFDFGWERVQPYFGFGVGTWFTSIVQSWPVAKMPVEGGASSGFVSLGARIALTDSLGLTIEDRLSIAEIPVPGTGIAQVGGNNLLLGLYYVWRE